MPKLILRYFALVLVLSQIADPGLAVPLVNSFRQIEGRDGKQSLIFAEQSLAESLVVAFRRPQNIVAASVVLAIVGVHYANLLRSDLVEAAIFPPLLWRGSLWAPRKHENEEYAGGEARFSPEYYRIRDAMRTMREEPPSTRISDEDIALIANVSPSMLQTHKSKYSDLAEELRFFKEEMNARLLSEPKRLPETFGGEIKKILGRSSGELTRIWADAIQAPEQKGPVKSLGNQSKALPNRILASTKSILASSHISAALRKEFLEPILDYLQERLEASQSFLTVSAYEELSNKIARTRHVAQGLELAAVLEETSSFVKPTSIPLGSEKKAYIWLTKADAEIIRLEFPGRVGDVILAAKELGSLTSQDEFQSLLLRRHPDWNDVVSYALAAIRRKFRFKVSAKRKPTHVPSPSTRLDDEALRVLRAIIIGQSSMGWTYLSSALLKKYGITKKEALTALATLKSERLVKTWYGVNAQFKLTDLGWKVLDDQKRKDSSTARAKPKRKPGKGLLSIIGIILLWQALIGSPADSALHYAVEVAA